MPTHFVESVMAFKPVCVLPRHSKRDIRGPSFHLHLSFSPSAGWVQLSLQGASFSTKCKPVRLKPPPMTMTMFLYRITNLQTSSEKHGKRSSCILLLGSRTSFFHGFNGVVRTLRRRPPAQVERQRKQVYNLTLVGPKSVGFLRCYTHMTQKDYLPKSNGREKQPSGRTSPQKSKITAAKPST